MRLDFAQVRRALSKQIANRIVTVYGCGSVAVGYVMIYGIGSRGDFGLTGAAITTVVAQASGGLTCLFLLYRRGGYLSEDPKPACFGALDVPCASEIYRTGISPRVKTFFWQLAASVISKIILFTAASILPPTRWVFKQK